MTQPIPGELSAAIAELVDDMVHDPSFQESLDYIESLRKKDWRRSPDINQTTKEVLKYLEETEAQ